MANALYTVPRWARAGLLLLLAVLFASSGAQAKCYDDVSGGGRTCEVILVPSAGGAGGATSVKIDQTTPGTTNGVQVNAALPAGSALVGKFGIDQTTPGTTNAVAPTGGPTAAGATLTANPLTTGCRATSSEPTAVTDGQVVNMECTLTGKVVVLPYAFNENLVSGAITSAMTGTTSTSLLAAPAGSLRNYITNITCSNSHATVGTDIVIQDGNGGTTLYTLPAAANYGGATIPFPAALRQPTAATAIYVANVTTGASTKCSASGYKAL